MSSWLTKRHLGIFLVVSVTTLFAAACASGDQGSQGAKGSQGDAGATGAPGSTGAPGTAGVSGPVSRRDGWKHVHTPRCRIYPG